MDDGAAAAGGGGAKVTGDRQAAADVPADVTATVPHTDLILILHGLYGRTTPVAGVVGVVGVAESSGRAV